MKLSTRLTLAIVGLVVVAVTAVGVLTYRGVAAALLPTELARLGSHADRLAADLAVQARGARTDVLAASGSAAMEGLLRAHLAGGTDPLDGSSEGSWRDRITTDFHAELRANPAYLQFRLIGAEGGGREIVRVERAAVGGPVRTVPDGELQRKGTRNYFTAAIGLADGEVHVTPIELNREHGEVQTPHVPVLRTATPVRAVGGGPPFGVLVVNVDLRPAFARLREGARTDARLYLVGTRGDYLIHPDPRSEFGIDLGRPARFDVDFPALAGVLDAGASTVRVIDDPAGRRLACALSIVRVGGGPSVAVVEAVPAASLVAATAPVRRFALLGGLAAAAAAAFVAVLLARSLTRPLAGITAAAEALARGEPAEVPAREPDEIGTLARAFARMSSEVRDKTADLEREIDQRRRAEDRFRLAVEASPNGMVMADGSGELMLVNTETERMFGYRREELIGRPVELLVPERFRAEHVGFRREYVGSPASRPMGAGRDLYGRRKDGSEFPVEIGLNPIPSGEGLLVLAAVVDITARKTAEAALRARTHELERSNAELESFAYVASHDLQEPLRMVASYTELLANRYRGRLDEKADRYIHFAVDGAVRMRQLVNDLLAFSRVGTQGGPLAPTDAQRVVDHVVAMMAPAIDAAGAEVAYADLPTISADETQLGQVFQNLLANALKFHSERPPRIRVEAAFAAGLWTFSVVDNGIGIDPQYADRVFQMFQRLHPRDRYEGSGIGLALVKKIVERHGGRVWFDPVPDGGTAFYFTMRPAEEET